MAKKTTKKKQAPKTLQVLKKMEMLAMEMGELSGQIDSLTVKPHALDSVLALQQMPTLMRDCVHDVAQGLYPLRKLEAVEVKSDPEPETKETGKTE